jgi:hypothetical protein
MTDYLKWSEIDDDEWTSNLFIIIINNNNYMYYIGIESVFVKKYM